MNIKHLYLTCITNLVIWKSLCICRKSVQCISYVLFTPRVLTGSKSSSSCLTFSGAKPGTVWNRIFKKHMTENESCIGWEKGSKQMQGSNQLFTQLFYYYGGQSCNVKILWKNPALKHESMALAKGI